eukprot:2528415-Amphidinium_carterae.1
MGCAVRPYGVTVMLISYDDEKGPSCAIALLHVKGTNNEMNESCKAFGGQDRNHYKQFSNFWKLTTMTNVQWLGSSITITM